MPKKTIGSPAGSHDEWSAASPLVERVARALRRAGVESAAQLRAIPSAQLRRLPGIGATYASTAEQLARSLDDARIEALLAIEAEPRGAGPRSLSAVEVATLRLRYSRGGTVTHTVEEVARELDVSTTRVHHCRANALRKLEAIADAVQRGREISDAAYEHLWEFSGLLLRRREGALR
jgi:hypothetical protein